uniref:EGF-like domain-containing protein n=1 Tax=Tetradesmus obliquus TaxID=3088 RepID=A0A383WGD1_TETOB|eukprot:jgi/Sobl393_1/9605/SZX76577.1
MARFALAVVLVALAASSVAAAQVSLSGFSCPAKIPGCAAKRCTVRTLGNQETHVCLRCQAGYTAVKGADGMSTVQCVPSTRSSLSGSSCSAQIPGCAAKRCTTRTISSQQTQVCLRCQAGYTAVKGADFLSTVQCVPAVAAPAAAPAAATRATSSSLAGISCPSIIPGCAAKRCTTRTFGAEQTHVCLRCQAGYTAVKGADGKSTGQCVPNAAAPAAISGQSCPTKIPGCAAKRCTTRSINSTTTFVCLRCAAGYTAVKGADGKSTVQCVAASQPAAQKVAILRSSLAGASCPAQIPGCAAKRCTVRTINSSTTHVCLRCQAGFVPVFGSDGVSAVQCQSAGDDISVMANSTASQQQQQQVVSNTYSGLLARVLAVAASV